MNYDIVLICFQNIMQIFFMSAGVLNIGQGITGTTVNFNFVTKTTITTKKFTVNSKVMSLKDLILNMNC